MPLIAVLFVFLSGSAFINRQAHKKQFEGACLLDCEELL
jgi:hypothetical protein